MKLSLLAVAAFVVAGCSAASEDASEATAADTEVASRTLVADVEHYDMLASESSVGLGGWIGYPTERATVHLELVESDGHRRITARLDDRSAEIRSLSTDAAEVSGDGSFVATGTTVDEKGPGCCPALYQRNTYDLTVIGRVTPEGQVTITTRAHREQSVRDPSHSYYTHLEDFLYVSHTSASATLR
jgi:hypothetical protein